MSKDRARDPKRVPSLGIGDPISHVKTLEGMPYHMPRQTKDGWTGETYYKSALTGENATAKEHDRRFDEKTANVNTDNAKARREDKVPVVKINTDPAKGK